MFPVHKKKKKKEFLNIVIWGFYSHKRDYDESKLKMLVIYLTHCPFHYLY